MAKQSEDSHTFPLWLRVSASSVLVLFVVAHLRYPSLAIDNTTLVLLLFILLVWTLPYVKSFTLPGGAGATLRDTIDDAERSLAKANLPPGSRGISLDEEQRTLSEQDPNLVLAGMRIQIEKLLREIGRYQSLLFPQGFGIGRMITALKQRNALNSELASALSDLVSLSNRAVHGADIQPDIARRAMDVGETIIAALQDKLDIYKTANDKWKDQSR